MVDRLVEPMILVILLGIDTVDQEKGYTLIIDSSYYCCCSALSVYASYRFKLNFKKS